VVDEAVDCPVVRVDFAGTTRRAYNAADAAGRGTATPWSVPWRRVTNRLLTSPSAHCPLPRRGVLWRSVIWSRVAEMVAASSRHAAPQDPGDPARLSRPTLQSLAPPPGRRRGTWTALSSPRSRPGPRSNDDCLAPGRTGPARLLEGDRRFGRIGAIIQWINDSFIADEGTAPLWRPG